MSSPNAPVGKILQFPAREEVAPLEQSEVSQTLPSTEKVISLSEPHMTTLPSTNGWRGILASFGSGLVQKPTLWTEMPGQKKETLSVLTTYNQTQLVIKAQGMAKKAIIKYLADMVGPEGLKVILALMSTWYDETQAKSSKGTVTLGIRQLLLHIGYDRKQANSKAEQQKAYYCILYLAHLSSRAKETRYLPENSQKSQGKKVRTTKTVEWEPPFTLKAGIIEGEDELPVVPQEITYGVSSGFFTEMFGEDKHFFRLPTKEVLKYNAKNEVHELCLVFYLSDMLIVSHGPVVRYLLSLVFSAGLHYEQDFPKDKNHLRFLDRVLLALEHIEINGWIRRSEQAVIDEILAIDLRCQSCKEEDISEATKERIRALDLTALDAKGLKKRKTELLKLLADQKHWENPVARLELNPGPLLESQVKKMRNRRAIADGRRQRAIEASTKRAAKNA